MDRPEDPFFVEPWALRIEASSFCQLKCPTCPTTTGLTREVVGRGFLKARDFRDLLTNAPFPIKLVELANYGESFLNPEFLDILQIAAEHGVCVGVFSGANLNNVREEVLEGLVKYGMLGITCSIDGASQETYSIYRRGGDYETVIANIEKINSYKAKYGTHRPRLTWQFVVFGHNEHEIETARAKAESLGMAFFPKLSWETGFSPVKDREAVMRRTGMAASNSSEFEQATKTPYMDSICEQMWQFPQINFDGRVLGCCANFWGEFGGDAFTDLSSALNSEKIRYARAMLSGQAPAREDIPCSTCDAYKSRLRNDNWVPADISSKIEF